MRDGTGFARKTGRDMKQFIRPGRTAARPMPEKRQLTGGRGVARLRHAARLRSVIALWLPVQPGGAARLRHAARLRSVIALWLLVQVGGAATFKFATVLSDHAVLQRDVAAPVWGFGEPGQQVRVALDGREVGSATVDAEGRWLVRLPPQKASASPRRRSGCGMCCSAKSGSGAVSPTWHTPSTDMGGSLSAAVHLSQRHRTASSGRFR